MYKFFLIPCKPVHRHIKSLVAVFTVCWLIALPLGNSARGQNLGERIRETWPAFVVNMAGGSAKAFADVMHSSETYRSSKLNNFRPISSGGNYWLNPKDVTWVRKWGVTSSGEVVVGYDRFFLSSTLLVTVTDAWHFSDSVRSWTGAVSPGVYMLCLDRKPDAIDFWLYLGGSFIARSIGFNITYNILRYEK
jgi:hypothetical protein